MKQLNDLLTKTNKQYSIKLDLLNLALQVDWENLPIDTPLRCWTRLDILDEDSSTDKSGFVAMYAGYSVDGRICIFRNGRVSLTANNDYTTVEIAVPLVVGTNFVQRHGLQP